MTTDLLNPVLSDLKNINFFEGRLLTGRDLQEQGTANLLQHRQLGRILGSGIAEGLEVYIERDGSDGTPPVLKVMKGLAINGTGQVLELAKDYTMVRLSRELDIPEPPDSYFKECTPPTSSAVPTGVGLYIFAMSPAKAYMEYAPKSGLQSEGVLSDCGRRYLVDGIQFRLEYINISHFSGIESRQQELEDLDETTATLFQTTAAVSLLRNEVAHACLGSASSAGYSQSIRKGESPAFEPRSNLLRSLNNNQQVNNCDVPLGLIYWDIKGIRFLDTWSVRRLARWQPSGERFSLFSVYGFERLLQFLDHLDGLMRPELKLPDFKIEDLFRFVPPVIYLPVKGANSPKGIQLTTFIGKFSRAPVGQLAAGMLAELIDQSLRYDAVDLKKKPFFQIFGLPQNEHAIQNGASSQRYSVLVSRSLNGPRTYDGVTKAFEDAWDAYRGLTKQRVFLPPADNADRISATYVISNAIRDVMNMVSRQAGTAASLTLSKLDALSAFQSVYDIQNEMSSLFQSNIPGITDTQQREVFAKSIDVLLNDTLPGGGLALSPAIGANDLPAAIDAQNTINSFVGSWSGEGVAIGPFGVGYINSLEGWGLVPGAARTPHTFKVFNGTDKNLTIKLEASITAPSGDWSDSIQILADTHGPEIDQVTLAYGTERQIVLMIGAPTGALKEEKPVLTINAIVDPPTDKTSTAYFDFLKVDDQSGGPVDGLIHISNHGYEPPVPDPSDLPPGKLFTMSANVKYESDKEAPVDFQLDINVTSESLDEWSFYYTDGNLLPTPQNGVYQLLVRDLTPQEGTRPAQWVIGAPGAGSKNKTATLELTIRSVDLESEISHTYDRSIILTVKGTGLG